MRIVSAWIAGQRTHGASLCVMAGWRGMGQNRLMLDRLRRWRRRSSSAASTNNVVSGSARNVVQAGYIGHVSLNVSSSDTLKLAIPTLDTVESLLSFANTTIQYVGRSGELAELTRFLAVESSFTWWVWHGPAGIGKSRLAIELCRHATASGRHAGFLHETDQAGIDSFHARRPTLIVVDYAAQRSKWLSDALALLSRQHHEFHVRVLVLERNTSGEWWLAARRVDRLEESYRVTSAMYAHPRPMTGLDRADARTGQEHGRPVGRAAAHHKSDRVCRGPG